MSYLETTSVSVPHRFSVSNRAKFDVGFLRAYTYYYYNK